MQDLALENRIKPGQALAVVRARLGRSPRDGLEAAVVLEAWAGVRPETALAIGEELMEVVPEDEHRSVVIRRRPTPERVSWFAEILGLLGFVSMASWGVPLGEMLPNVDVDVAFKVGVPVALALQWFVRRRYFSGEKRLGSFGTDGWRFLVGFCALIAAFAFAGPTGLLIAALQVIWFSGYLLSVDRCGLAYVAGLGAITAALYSEQSPETVIPVVGGLLATITLWRVVRHTRARNKLRERMPPVTWAESVPSAFIGASLGMMMVFSLTQLRPNGWTLAAALIPAGVASLVVAAMNRSMWIKLDDQFAHTRGAEVGVVGARTVRLTMWGAWLAYVAIVTVLSIAVAPLLAEAGQSTAKVVPLLIGFALFCALTMTVDLQHSWNRISSAASIAMPACAVEMSLSLTGTAAAYALVVGASVGLLVSVRPQATMMRSPTEVLATSISIS